MNNNQVKVLYSDVSNSVPSCASLQEKNSGGGWRLYPILSYALAIGGTSKTSNDNIARNGREKLYQYLQFSKLYFIIVVTFTCPWCPGVMKALCWVLSWTCGAYPTSQCSDDDVLADGCIL